MNNDLGNPVYYRTYATPHGGRRWLISEQKGGKPAALITEYNDYLSLCYYGMNGRKYEKRYSGIRAWYDARNHVENHAARLAEAWAKNHY